RVPDRDVLQVLEEGLHPARDPDPVRGPPRRSLEDEPPHHLGSRGHGVDAEVPGSDRPLGVTRVRGVIIVTAALVLSAEARFAAADGAWTAMVRPRNYADLVALDDTVWCASLEAGLIEYNRATRTFRGRTREPGALASNRVSALA